MAEILEGNRVYVNQKPKGEPQLGKRGLYGNGQTVGEERQRAYLWVLNLSDGKHSLLDIAERANLPFHVIKQAAEALAATDLLTLQ